MTSKVRRAKATDYEKVTARIYSILSPEGTVTHNDKIYGRDSGKDRQIDVSIKSQVAGHEILVIVQCKDYKSKVNVDRVGEFHSVMKDVGAHRGVMVTSVGYSDGAKRYAKNNGIDLCHVHDAETMNWKRVIEIPIIIEKVFPEINVNFKVHLDGGTSFKEDAPFVISDIDVLKSFSEKWNNMEFDPTKDRFDYDLGVPKLFFRDIHGKEIVISELNISVVLSRQSYWTYFSDLPRSKAIENVSSGKTELLISEQDFSELSPELHYLKDITTLPFKMDLNLKVLSTPRLDLKAGGRKVSLQKID